MKVQSISRARPLLAVLLSGALAAMGGCASKPVDAVVAAPIKLGKVTPLHSAHAHTRSACTVAHGGLPAQRKEALFEQFASEEGAATPPAATPALPTARPIPHGCHLAAR